MEKVTGIGGIFWKGRDPKALQAWYVEQLGVPNHNGFMMFEWPDQQHPEATGQTLLSTFPEDTKYFEPSRAPFMINLRVRNLDAMLAQLRAAGATVDEKVDEGEFGRFGWVMDPEGNRIELWEPPGSR
jgi:predicted enzyme related to lactoylglutathione lyase